MRRFLIAYALATVASAGPLAPALAAHEGHDHKILGIVSAVHDKQLDLKTRDGKSETIVLTDQTKILKGKAPLQIADLKPGDRVSVNVGTGKAPLTAKEIVVGATTTKASRIKP